MVLFLLYFKRQVTEMKLVFFNVLTSIAIIIAIPATGSGNLASHKFVWTSVSHFIWPAPESTLR